MRHYRQGPSECFPTAIACYLEKQPRQVIREILGRDLVAYGWCQLTWNVDNPVFQIVENRVKSFLLRSKLEWLLPNAFVRPVEDGSIYTIWDFPLKLTGRGFLTSIGFNGASFSSRHIVAFDGGTIYDSNLNIPVPYELYRLAQKHRNKVVDGIYLEPRGETA